ncbi:MAG: acetyl/propionyl/methylcrotonyl-CoA carboxylase subunit alpha [Actinomycetota bacterium]
MRSPSPLQRLLVANRGEIARRIFATCRRMGIETVAVYSDPDRTSPFVLESDQAFSLGGVTSAESYLSIEAVLEAAHRSGADAVHPGYGFLAENARFARAVEEAGLIWVGPPPQAMETMGSKLAAKALMERCGVPTLGGSDLGGMDDEQVSKAAAGLGYPVLVKASAGGGGKGMRVVTDPSSIVEAVAAARRESAGAFGDDTVFVERYLEAPRHIEIQVMADREGRTVSLFERECSIQRRHQKIIEETPSVALDEETRVRMSEAAVAAARAVDYVGAGTVEFLYQDGDFYFLEMNTRLQVEHPVTEMITGLDLVRLQLLVAAGHRLPREATEPTRRGHAVEARLYAEDPAAGFLPVTGEIRRVRFPRLDNLRVDSGVEDGSRISPHYDPMLAKVVAWGPTREEAVRLLARSLESTSIHGSTTNRNLLVRILRHPEFLAGDTDTHFLSRHDPGELSGPLADAAAEQRAAVAAALAFQASRRRRTPVLGTIPSGWRNVPTQMQTVSFQGEHGAVEVNYRFGRDGLEVAGYGGVRLVDCRPEQVVLELDGRLGRYDVARYDDVVFVDGPGGTVRLTEDPRFPAHTAGDAPGSLHAPMPGTVIGVEVAEGDAIHEGQVLIVMEAMKMEHALRAPQDGVVAEVRAAAGDQVSSGEVLVIVGDA